MAVAGERAGSVRAVGADPVDLLLGELRGGQHRHAPLEQPERLAQAVLVERLDDVVDGAELDRGAHRGRRGRCGDGDHLDRLAAGAQAAKEVEPALARQPDVEQDQVGMQGAHRGLGLRGAAGDADDVEAAHAPDEAPVHLGHDPVVLDDEHAPVRHPSPA